MLAYSTIGSASSWMALESRQLLHGLGSLDAKLLEFIQRLSHRIPSRPSDILARQLEREASVVAHAQTSPAERVQIALAGDNPALMLHFALSVAALRRIAISTTIDREQLWLASGSRYYGKTESDKQVKRKLPHVGTPIRWLIAGPLALAACSVLLCRRKRRGRSRRKSKQATLSSSDLAFGRRRSIPKNHSTGRFELLKLGRSQTMAPARAHTMPPAETCPVGADKHAVVAG